eukprot:8602766-Pyramimonas_sp.AAC.1
MDAGQKQERALSAGGETRGRQGGQARSRRVDDEKCGDNPSGLGRVVRLAHVLPRPIAQDVLVPLRRAWLRGPSSSSSF